MNHEHANQHSPGREHVLHPQMADEYTTKSKVIDQALSMINNTADPSVASIHLLQQKNELLKREIARVSKIIEETGGVVL